MTFVTKILTGDTSISAAQELYLKEKDIKENDQEGGYMR
jgi:hypothetical protein